MNSGTNPWIHCGIVLRTDEDACQVVTEGAVTSVRYAPRFPVPRRERVLPGHLVAIAERDGTAVVVWRWYNAVVLDSDPELRPPLGASARRSHRQATLPAGAIRSRDSRLPVGGPARRRLVVAGQAVDRPEHAGVELGEVDRLYTEHDLWNSAFG